MKVRLMNEAMSYHIVFVFLLVPAYVRAISLPQQDGEAADENICKDHKCEKFVNMTKKQMGKEMPCQDFHNYVCGDWKGELELNETHLKKKAVRTLANILEKAVAPTEKMFSATDKLIQAFKSCTMNGHNNKTLITSIERVIKKYNFTQWPIIEPEPKSASIASEAYMDVLKKTGPHPVFSYSISGEVSDAVITMTKPWEFNVFEDQELTLPDSHSDPLIDTEGEPGSTPVNYEDYSDVSRKQEDAYKTFIIKAIRLLNESVSEKDATEVAEGIIGIEKMFAKLANDAETAKEQRVNISHLNALVGDGFSMVPILQRDFEGLNIDIDENTEVDVRYIEYYEKAVNFMRCITMAKLTNYVLWTKIRKMAEATGTLLNDIYVEYKHNTSSPDLPYAETSSGVDDTEKATRLKVRCMRQLLETGVMYTAGAHYYVMAKFNETAKKRRSKDDGICEF